MKISCRNKKKKYLVDVNTTALNLQNDYRKTYLLHLFIDINTSKLITDLSPKENMMSTPFHRTALMDRYGGTTRRNLPLFISHRTFRKTSRCASENPPEAHSSSFTSMTSQVADHRKKSLLTKVIRKIVKYRTTHLINYASI